MDYEAVMLKAGMTQRLSWKKAETNKRNASKNIFHVSTI